MAKKYSMNYIQPRPTAQMPNLYAPRKAPVATPLGSAYPAPPATQATTVSYPGAGLTARKAQITADFAKVREQAAQERARLQAQAILRESDRSAALRGAGSSIPRASYSYGAPVAQAPVAAAPMAPAPVAPQQAAPGRYVTGYGQPTPKPSAGVGRFSDAETAANRDRMLAIARARGAGQGELDQITTNYGRAGATPLVRMAETAPLVRPENMSSRPLAMPEKPTTAYRKPSTAMPQVAIQAPQILPPASMAAREPAYGSNLNTPLPYASGARVTSGAPQAPAKPYVRGTSAMAGKEFTLEGGGYNAPKYRMNRNGELRPLARIPIGLDYDTNTPGVELGSGIKSGRILVGPDGSRYSVGPDGFISRI